MGVADLEGVRVVVLLNRGSSPQQCEEKERAIRAAMEGAGITGEIVTCEPARLTETARRLADRDGVDAIVSAGGDGTASSVAAGVVGTGTPMAVLPMGTLNHFARDLGMPTELGEAMKAIAAGKVTQVDVGEVNGRAFVNNSSIGLYPEVVRMRDRDRHEKGRNKWFAMVLAAMRVLWRFRLLAVRVEMPHRVLSMITPFVFVGNNDYSTNVGSLGQRERLDSGRLALYIVRTHGRMHTILVLLRAMFGRAEAVQELETERVTELWVAPHERSIKVALDGEVFRMAAPLHYRIRPGELAVIASVAAAAEKAEAV
jgi:diacylglycerol kinase family enzyme